MRQRFGDINGVRPHAFIHRAEVVFTMSEHVPRAAGKASGVLLPPRRRRTVGDTGHTRGPGSESHCSRPGLTPSFICRLPSFKSSFSSLGEQQPPPDTPLAWFYTHTHRECPCGAACRTWELDDNNVACHCFRV